MRRLPGLCDQPNQTSDLKWRLAALRSYVDADTADEAVVLAGDRASFCAENIEKPILGCAGAVTRMAIVSINDRRRGSKGSRRRGEDVYRRVAAPSDDGHQNARLASAADRRRIMLAPTGKHGQRRPSYEACATPDTRRLIADILI